MIEEDYRNHMLLDNLPIAMSVFHENGAGPFSPSEQFRCFRSSFAECTSRRLVVAEACFVCRFVSRRMQN